MKILVIDDTAKHLVSAKQTLVGHDLTVCSSHDEAYELLDARHDRAELERRTEVYKAQGMGNWPAYCKAEGETRIPYWDVVLSDLLMPAGKMAQGGEGLRLVGQEMPVGWSLALRAAKNGVKFVAVVTDMNHHHHPASAMLDPIDGHPFVIDGAKAIFTNNVHWVGIAGTEIACPECRATGKRKRQDGTEHKCWNCNGNGKTFADSGKDWGKILAQLLESEKE